MGPGHGPWWRGLDRDRCPVLRSACRRRDRAAHQSGGVATWRHPGGRGGDGAATARAARCFGSDPAHGVLQPDAAIRTRRTSPGIAPRPASTATSCRISRRRERRAAGRLSPARTRSGLSPGANVDRCSHRGGRRRASGFVYCVSLTGVTGQRDALPDLPSISARVRARTDVPMAVGFGVSTPEHVRQVGEVADGAVVASAMINFLDTVPEAEQAAGGGSCSCAASRGGAIPGHPAPVRFGSDSTPVPQSEIRKTVTRRANRLTSRYSEHRPVACRGIRGATTVETNTAEDILEATTDLLTPSSGSTTSNPGRRGQRHLHDHARS